MFVSTFYEIYVFNNLIKEYFPSFYKKYNIPLVYLLFLTLGLVFCRIFSCFQSECEINYVGLSTQGMSFIGGIFFSLFVILCLEYLYNINSLKMADILIITFTFRTYLVRIGSWLKNDLSGIERNNLNKGNNFRYDTQLWEAITEGKNKTWIMDIAWTIKE